MQKATVALWQVELGGRVYTARPLSVDQVHAWSDAHNAAERLPDERFRRRVQIAALHRLFRRAFPWRWRYLLHPQEDPLWHFWRLGEKERDRVAGDFFVHRGILEPSEVPPRPSKPGSSSAPSPSSGSSSDRPGSGPS
jgi:hypothetical protein